MAKNGKLEKALLALVSYEVWDRVKLEMRAGQWCCRVERVDCGFYRLADEPHKAVKATLQLVSEHDAREARKPMGAA